MRCDSRQTRILRRICISVSFFFFQAEDGIRDLTVTGVQTCALPILRRGKMTFHVRYGYSSSLLTADFVFAMILAIAARYKDKRVADEISSAALQMAEGEYSELTVDPKNYKLGWDEYVKIISERTAALFQASAKLGGLIAGASANRVDALANYGKFVGIAYQLRDDLLDWGSQDKITRA